MNETTSTKTPPAGTYRVRIKLDGGKFRTVYASDDIAAIRQWVSANAEWRIIGTNGKCEAATIGYQRIEVSMQQARSTGSGEHICMGWHPAPEDYSITRRENV